MSLVAFSIITGLVWFAAGFYIGRDIGKNGV